MQLKDAIQPLVILLTWMAPPISLAQGTFEAIKGITGPGLPGYINNNTIGWAFTPTVDIQVTSMGVFSANTSAPWIEVGLWASDGTFLTATIVHPSSPLLNFTRYEP